MAAVARALEALPPGSTAKLFLLEAYIVNAFAMGHLDDWKRRRFRRRHGPLDAADIWRRINRVRCVRRIDITASHVKETSNPVGYGKLAALADLIEQKKMETGK